MFSSYSCYGTLTGTIYNLANAFAPYVPGCHYPRYFSAHLLVSFNKSMRIGTQLLQG
jgi:hypothetical protein